MVILSAYGLSSCEKVIDISIPDKERKLVVNGIVSPDKPVVVQLSRSRYVLETDMLNLVSGGVIRLYHGNDPVGTLQEGPSGEYSLTDFRPQAGMTYRLTASYAGLKPVEAEATLPSPVPISAVDTATVTGEWGQQELRISIIFKDPAGIRNYYGFGADITYKEFDYGTMTYTGRKLTHPAYLSGRDDRFVKEESTTFDGKLYFDDLLFDGLNKTVSLGITDYSLYESDTVWLNVRMDQTDAAFYRYVVSYSAYEEAHGNPFSEPVQVFSNINGGFGIFSGYSTATYPLVIRGVRKF